MSNLTPTTQKVTLVSPFTRQNDEYDLPANQSEHQLICPHTNKPFRALILTVQSKTAKRAKNGGRDFDVRGRTVEGPERRLTFNHGRDEDFELRPKDIVAFLYEGDKLLYVQNLTTRRAWGISSWGF
ncbi:MAG: hypothetical protein M1546_15780 [Chloroflexi bacterium]|nr:hypothetical protein [Chloroflexota bacterium]